MDKRSLNNVYSGKSPEKAIVLFCHECMGYDAHKKRGTGKISYQKTTVDVSNCVVDDCPLWLFRE